MRSDGRVGSPGRRPRTGHRDRSQRRSAHPRAAADLAGTPVPGTGHLIALVVDAAGLHRRRVWEAFAVDTGRTNRWGALSRLGATIRAHDLVDFEEYRSPRPMQIRQGHHPFFIGYPKFRRVLPRLRSFPRNPPPQARAISPPSRGVTVNCLSIQPSYPSWHAPASSEPGAGPV